MRSNKVVIFVPVFLFQIFCKGVAADFDHDVKSIGRQIQHDKHLHHHVRREEEEEVRRHLAKTHDVSCPAKRDRNLYTSDTRVNFRGRPVGKLSSLFRVDSRSISNLV